MMKSLFQGSGICLAAICLAYCVIVLGAYVRLSDAGLGCPDWPGCYGKLIVPELNEEVLQANEAFPERPLEKGKAWKEMIHRYAAGMLGMLILFIAIGAWKLKNSGHKEGFLIAQFLLMLVIFQAALGMWTVTLLLKPVVVTAHLMGGMSVLGLLHWLFLNRKEPRTLSFTGAARVSLLALVVLVSQIALGGWTSANYAALICTDFPGCQGSFWPDMNFKEGFTLWRGLGVNYEGGVLDASARTAIHFTHRVGAVVTTLVVFISAIIAIRSHEKAAKWAGGLVFLFLLIQVSLGIANVMLGLPLPVAVAHNGVAALLLLSVITQFYFLLCEPGK